MTSFTPLQRAVIRRLQDAGFAQLAEMVEDAWSRGERITISSEIDPDIPHAALLVDLAKANEQVHTELPRGGASPEPAPGGWNGAA